MRLSPPRGLDPSIGSAHQPFAEQPKSTLYVLATLSTIGFIASIKALLFPLWPSVPEINSSRFESTLRSVDPSVISLPTLPSVRKPELALSSQSRWRLTSGHELILIHSAVKQPLSFQTAFITRNLSSLSLSKRRVDTPSAGSDSGFISSHPAFQTCVARTSSGLVNGTTISQLIHLYSNKGLPAFSSLQAVLAIHPSRSYDCLLVTLRGSPGQQISPKLWATILESVHAYAN